MGCALGCYWLCSVWGCLLFIKAFWQLWQDPGSSPYPAWETPGWEGAGSHAWGEAVLETVALPVLLTLLSAGSPVFCSLTPPMPWGLSRNALVPAAMILRGLSHPTPQPDAAPGCRAEGMLLAHGPCPCLPLFIRAAGERLPFPWRSSAPSSSSTVSN